MSFQTKTLTTSLHISVESVLGVDQILLHLQHCQLGLSEPGLGLQQDGRSLLGAGSEGGGKCSGSEEGWMAVLPGGTSNSANVLDLALKRN